MDFASIEEMDPSVADGFRVIYDREVPFELRLQESAEGPNDVGTLEAIKVRVANAPRVSLSSPQTSV